MGLITKTASIKPPVYEKPAQENPDNEGYKWTDVVFAVVFVIPALVFVVCKFCSLCSWAWCCITCKSEKEEKIDKAAQPVFNGIKGIHPKLEAAPAVTLSSKAKLDQLVRAYDPGNPGTKERLIQFFLDPLPKDKDFQNGIQNRLNMITAKSIILELNAYDTQLEFLKEKSYLENALMKLGKPQLRSTASEPSTSESEGVDADKTSEKSQEEGRDDFIAGLLKQIPAS